MQERGRRGGKAQAAGAKPSACQLQRGRPAGTGLGSRLQAPAYSRGAPSPCCEHQHVCPILSALSHGAAPPPALLYFLLLLTCPNPRAPDPSIHTRRPSHPHRGPPSRLASGAASGSAAGGPRPARRLRRGLGRPASAAQPRPSTHGRGEAQTQPPALDAGLCHPPRPSSRAFDAF